MKKHHTEEQILGILKEAELGKPLPELLRQHGFGDTDAGGAACA